MELGMGELLVVFVVFMLLFGANKLPQLGEGLGKAIRNFKSSMRGDDEPPATATQPPAAPKELPAHPASETAKVATEERGTVPRA